VNNVGYSALGGKEVLSSLSLENYFNELETRLGSILLMLGPQLSPEESWEVNHFLDVGEYGLALQTLTALLIEERKKIRRGTYNDIAGVANRMGMEREIALEDLQRCVDEEIYRQRTPSRRSSRMVTPKKRGRLLKASS
jgi:hypothetical protein